MGERVRGFERAEDAFARRQQPERGERFVVGRADILRAAGVHQVRMLGADGGIIEARRDRPGVGDLAVLVLQDIGLSAVENAGPAAKEGRAMLARRRGPCRRPRRRSGGRRRR